MSGGNELRMMKLCGMAVVIALVAIAASARASENDLEITRRDQTALSLTIYKNFAVVRDVRRATLPRGIADVDFEDVAKTIDPASVRVKSIGREDLFTVEQQTYEYDLLNKESLLQRYIGKKLKYSRSVRTGDTYERVFREGTLLAINPEIVRFGDEVEIAPQGTISLPSIPRGLLTVPTLVWHVDNRYGGTQTIEVSYLANRLSWSADYRLDLNQDESTGDLTVWASVNNESGLSYRDAKIQLVAGDVKRVKRSELAPTPAASLMRMQSDIVTGEPFFEYYMYHLQGSVDLDQRETHQFHLMSAEDVPVTKSYRLTTQVPEHPLQSPLDDWFDVRISFQNLARYGLGVALPEGIFRVFKVDRRRASQLLGEDRLEHKSKGQMVTVSVGKAFDLEAVHTQTAWRRLSNQGSEISYKVSLHNRKHQKVQVVLDEKFAGDWKITDQSLPGKRVDSTTERYGITLGPAATRTLAYTVRINP